MKTYIDESHLWRHMLKCKKCGQLYFFEFFEQIDWKNGDDPQYCTFIPVKDIAEADELNKLTVFQLLNVKPQLRDDFRDTIRVYWAR